MGLAFWSPDLLVACIAPITNTDIWYGDIFFNEGLAVVSAIEWAASLPGHPKHLIVQTDSMNMVDIFHSLFAEPDYILLLLRAVEVMMDKEIKVSMVHIPGTENLIADAVGRIMVCCRTHHQKPIWTRESCGVGKGHTS